jgi:ectoine hydroxylase-related dioxygenase (phytanoyl-CoA dioxygenase family)
MLALSPTFTSTQPYHLTPEQVQFFDENGYLILRNHIPADMLARLQAAAEAWVRDGWDKFGESEIQQKWDADWAFAMRAAGKVMYRVNYLHDKGRSASLELLGSPVMLGIAESLAGPNFVPTYESMVFKQEGDGEVIMWHQDAVHPRAWRIFNVDVYLDASTADGGALRVIPRSQHAKIDACALRDEHGWNPPGVIIADMAPGDVLIHDVMVVHGSPRTAGNALRRTLYYEFRAAEQILTEGPWDREWIDKRLHLIPVALKAHARAYPDVAPFAWNIAPEFAPAVIDDDAVALKVAHDGIHTSGAFCSAGDVPLKK